MTTIRARFDALCPVCDAAIRRWRELITSWTDPDGNETWVHTQQCAPAVGAAVTDPVRSPRRRKARGRS